MNATEVVPPPAQACPEREILDYLDQLKQASAECRNATAAVRARAAAALEAFHRVPLPWRSVLNEPAVALAPDGEAFVVALSGKEG